MARLGRASCRSGRGLLEDAPRGLLLNFLVVILALEFINEIDLITQTSALKVDAPSISPSQDWRPVRSMVSQAKAGISISTHQHRQNKLYSSPVALSSVHSPMSALSYSSSSGASELSFYSSDLSDLSVQHNRRSAADVPANVDAAPPDAASNTSAAPSGLVQPPVSPHNGCCASNMVQRRGSQDCHCVYPVRVELFLRNVSLNSNWSNEFLEELAAQLNLRVSQFEIVNFYVVGASGLNITMNIAPHTGNSFPADQVTAMNYSLSLHKVQINPVLVGDYSLLNLTWFRSLAPAPAPGFMISPKASPSTSSTLKSPSEDTSNGTGRHSSLITVICICIGALIGVLVIVLFICFCTFRKGKKKVPPVETPKQRTPDAVSAVESLPRPTSTRFLAYEELKEATNNFEASSVLGEGGFGRVFKGILSDGTAVAIKKLTTGGHQGDKEFLVEVEMLSRLHHRNLVKLIGYYSNRELSQSLLCYELVPNGSLEAWLHGSLGANCPLDWDTRMKIALDAARGLAYLHEDSQPCVIHRDFKASNILLENDFHAKVSDFGLAKQAPEGRLNYLSTRVMGTFGYVAPEYAMTGHLIVKSDVYSYGVVLLELLTGRRPVDMSQSSGQENLVTWTRPVLRDKDRLQELADPRLGGQYPKDDFVRVCTIAAACVSPEANQRPTMGEVVQSLKMVQRSAEFQESIPTPPARPNIRQAMATYESDGTSSMFSSGPFSGLSPFETENISRTAIFSEDLHEGR
ncbi:hypothetical protein BRADI_2g08937v3 [Brachypodium distachyon]|uniref:Protein kinase domain-containing protein n=1 Tax=Brachypodium distachyon TaxID=15368 RepID=I1HDY7_BRADI|nr:hypothetical protein BRADI_2g08937v3 [Brachypodium distachyon]